MGIRVDKDERYIIEDYGHCLTMRFDSDRRIPNLLRSENVLGYTREPQGLYVSLAPGKRKAMIVLSESTPSPFDGRRAYLKKATGWVRDFLPGEGGLKLNYKGFGKGRIGRCELGL